MKCVSKTITLSSIAREIAKQKQGLKIKDVKQILELEQDVIEQYLQEDRVVKWGKSLRFVPTKHKATIVYNGMLNKTIPIPPRSTIKVVKLSRFKHLTKKL